MCPSSIFTPEYELPLMPPAFIPVKSSVFTQAQSLGDLE